MKNTYKKILGAVLPIPLLFVITVCCCLDESVLADETLQVFPTEHQQSSYELEKTDHLEHQNHSEGDQECSCPKHLSFLSAQSADIVFTSASQLLAKNFMVNFRFENVIFLASLSNQSQGPPLGAALTVPLYIQHHSLRI